ncbi:MAG TPA: phosphatase PAP2 family protein [Candidatus Sulfopaludibacter sp.]|jgi:membrane-associated phospholipid phosphatase|nr:phosphatase PAP2 family protein [Candidatus Sulfopaludibacter sp.]
MKVITFLLDPRVLPLILLAASIFWMLRDERDRERPLLVLAFVLNVFYGFTLQVVMGHADGLMPWKFDYYLDNLDVALGFPAYWTIRIFGATPQLGLALAYHLLVPMMIFSYANSRRRKGHPTVFQAYAAELAVGPIFYALLPASGPIYAFAATWPHHVEVPLRIIRLSAPPNAFPSLHLATALLFFLFSEGRVWRAWTFCFLVLTALATLSTGEHYMVDLVGGVAFGCFAAAVAYRRWGAAGWNLAVVLAWVLGIRYGTSLLLSNPWLLRSAAVASIVAPLYMAVRFVRVAPKESHWPGGIGVGADGPIAVASRAGN